MNQIYEYTAKITHGKPKRSRNLPVYKETNRVTADIDDKRICAEGEIPEVIYADGRLKNKRKEKHQIP